MIIQRVSYRCKRKAGTRPPLCSQVRHITSKESVKPKRAVGYWKYPRNRREYLDTLVGKQIGDVSALYRVSWEALVKDGASALLQLYTGSPSLLIMTEYPEHCWYSWRFRHSPPNYWSSLASLAKQNDPIALTAVRTYVEDELSSEYNVSSPEDWMKVLADRSLISKELGPLAHRLAHFGGIIEVLRMLYTQYDWSVYDRDNTHDSNLRSSFDLGRKVFEKCPSGFWNVQENRRKFMEFLLFSLGGDTNKLYSVTRSDFIKLGGSTLLLQYNSSVAKAIISELPEHDWKVWKFAKAPHGWWSQLAKEFKQKEPGAIKIVREYIEYLMKEYNIENWSSVRELTFPKQVRRRLILMGGLEKILPIVFPEIPENNIPRSEIIQIQSHGSKSQLPKHTKRPKVIDYSLPINRWRFFTSLISSSFDDLYKLTRQPIRDSAGSALLRSYQSSPALAIMCEIADHAWKPWKFSLSPRRWWNDLADLFKKDDPVALAVVREYLEEIAAQYNVQRIEDWNHVTINQTAECYRILRLGALSYVISKAYDQREYHTNEPTAIETPKTLSYWQIAENRKKYLDYLKNILGGTMEDFYKVTRQHFINTGGVGLLSRYNYSAVQTILHEYPSHDWKIWKCHSPARMKQYWIDLANRLKEHNPEAEKEARSIILDIAREHQISTLNDLYRMSASRVGNKLAKKLRYLGNLPLLLKRLFPEHIWNDSLLRSEMKRTEQMAMKSALQEIFPDHSIEQTNEWLPKS